MPLFSEPHGLAAARRAFWWMFWGTLLLKLGLAATFPMTGDEAFFYQWGVTPAWGYSDHPPMVGWWLAVLRQLGDHPLALRLATVAVTSVIALGVVDVVRLGLRHGGEASAWWAGAVYLAMPWSWLFVLVTTDTPLLLFMALSAWCLVRAEAAGGRLGGYALAGLFIGLAFLSKYFAALLGIAYAVYFLGWRRQRWWALPWMALFALPAVLVNLGFNATHGWPNILFNFLNRHENAQWQWQTLAVYLGMIAYLFTPWLLWSAWRGRAGGTGISRLLLVLWAFPLLVFTLFALRRSVGLHWVLGFVPLFVVWAAWRVEAGGAWRRVWRWTLWLSLPHLLAVAAIAWAPLAWWQGNRLYDKVVFLREVPAVLAGLQAGMAPGTRLMAHAYSPASILSYYSGTYVPVYGAGRHHARQDDLSVDFRQWDGASVRVLFRDPVAPQDHQAYFEQVDVRRFEVAGVPYFALEGRGFRYQAYRDTVLAEAARRFHDVPDWLPNWGSPFCERYGFADCAPAPAR